MKQYTKTSFDFKERPFNVGGRVLADGTIRRYRNRYGQGAKLRRDRINRSFKKGLRQQFKREIRNELMSTNKF